MCVFAAAYIHTSILHTGMARNLRSTWDTSRAPRAAAAATADAASPSGGAGSDGGAGLEARAGALAERASNWFPLWVLVGCAPAHSCRAVLRSQACIGAMKSMCAATWSKWQALQRNRLCCAIVGVSEKVHAVQDLTCVATPCALHIVLNVNLTAAQQSQQHSSVENLHDMCKYPLHWPFLPWVPSLMPWTTSLIAPPCLLLFAARDCASSTVALERCLAASFSSAHHAAQGAGGAGTAIGFRLVQPRLHHGGPGADHARDGHQPEALGERPVSDVESGAVWVCRCRLRGGNSGSKTAEAGLPRRTNRRGAGLPAQDFTEVLQRPKLVMLGAALQYTVMPGLGFLISRLFNLPPAYAVGCVMIWLRVRLRVRVVRDSQRRWSLWRPGMRLSWHHLESRASQVSRLAIRSSTTQLLRRCLR